MSGLKDREAKRKQSIVGAIIDNPEITPNAAEADAPTPPEPEMPNHNNDAFVIKPKQKEETRSKRINLLLQPSVCTKAQKKCKKLGISLNECINQFLENWTADENSKEVSKK